MALTFDPIQPWAYLGIALLAASIVGMLWRGRVDRWRTFGNKQRTRTASLILSLLAALLFAAALWNPFLVRRDAPGEAHFVLLLDTSDSARRVAGGWADFQRNLGRDLRRLIRRMPADQRAKVQADLITFADGVVRVADNLPLNDLEDALAGLTPANYAAGNQSDLAAGLEAAGRRIAASGAGQGAVLLVSDGNQTRGDAQQAANRLAQQGIPVHVLSLESAGPQLSVTAADLPRQVYSGNETFLRGVLRNSAGNQVPGGLTISRNPGLETDSEDVVSSMTTSRQVMLSQWSRLRQPLVFEGYGLQFLDVSLNDAQGREVHRRRFFTHVNRPPHILAVGGDFRWVNAFPKSTAVIKQIAPEDLTGPAALREQDAVVISAVSATRLPRKGMEALASAVNRDGVGLMLLNGDHEGYDAEAETVLMSYRDTPLAPILPVNPGPRPKEEEPSRNVILMIDTSGSMGGYRLRQAKEIAAHIVGKLLSSKDRLDLITFTRGVGHPIKDMEMTDTNRDQALEVIRGLYARGGTDPNAALQLLADRQLIECGLIFLSDGEFGPVAARPDCRATVFAIGKNTIPGNSPMWTLSDPIPVPTEFNPNAIDIPFFNPEPRDSFWEPGPFSALPIDRFGLSEAMPVPDLPLPGDAISYIKKDTELMAVRPKFTDPILAYRRAGMGYVGVVTTGFPRLWREREAGREAIVSWITRLLAYTARDRYDFRVTDRGETLELEIALLAQDNVLPRVEALSVGLDLGLETPMGIAMRADEAIPGVFRGRVVVPRLEQARKAVLEIKERGADALIRPQRVPILIPGEGLVNTDLSGEAFSYGTNEPLLRALADSGGGLFNPDQGDALFRKTPVITQGQPWWSYLALFAAAAYLAAFGVRRFDP